VATKKEETKTAEAKNYVKNEAAEDLTQGVAKLSLLASEAIPMSTTTTSENIPQYITTTRHCDSYIPFQYGSSAESLSVYTFSKSTLSSMSSSTPTTTDSKPKSSNTN
jgi:hypothetical protein